MGESSAELPPTALKRAIEPGQEPLERLGFEARELDFDVDHRQPEQRDAPLALFGKRDLDLSGGTDHRDRPSVSGERSFSETVGIRRVEVAWHCATCTFGVPNVRTQAH